MNMVPSMEQQFLEKLVEIIEDNFDNAQFQVTDLASAMGMSRATLHRKVKASTGKTISQFINEVRLNAAHKLLENRSGTVAEVAYLVGFSSSTYFIKCFGELFGYSPGEVLKENFKRAEKPEEKKKKLPTYYRWTLFVTFVLLVIVAIVVLNKNNSQAELSQPNTKNQAALNLYLQGLNLMHVYAGSQDEQHYVEAEKKYKAAVALDSTFGDAYAHLAEIHLQLKPYSDFGINYIKKAEYFGVSDTDFLLQMKSIYFQSIQNYEEALHILNLRWEDREKDFNYYSERGNHAYLMRDYAITIDNLLEYLHLKPSAQIPKYDRLMKLALTFSHAGFEQEAQEFAYRQFVLINDSGKYWSWYPRIMYECGNLQKTIDHYETAYANKERGTSIYNKLLEMYLLNGQIDKGLKILPEYIAYNKKLSDNFIPNYLVAYYLFIQENNELTEVHFRQEINRWEYFCEATETQESLSNYLTVAACYSMLNDTENTIKSLQKLATKNSIPYLIVLKLQKSPMFDNCREDPHFIKIQQDIEGKYRVEQKKIQTVLDEYPVEFTYKQNGVILERMN